MELLLIIDSVGRDDSMGAASCGQGREENGNPRGGRNFVSVLLAAAIPENECVATATIL